MEALSVPTPLVSPDERKLPVQLTVGTILVQGTTIKPLLRALRLSSAKQTTD